MNEIELLVAWVRWMHRNDLQADLNTVMELTKNRITMRLMYQPDPNTTLDESIALAPTVWHHAGLCSLHQLAQDDEGLQREMVLFKEAIRDHHFRRSIDAGPAVMEPENGY